MSFFTMFNGRSTTHSQDNQSCTHQDRLKSLIASIEGLREDVAQLRDDNANLTSEVQRLQGNSGAKFRLFPKLPIEVRRMIWDFALTTPQIHIMWDSLISQSKINHVMQSCKEARDEGLRLHMSYFQLQPPGQELEDAPKNYINLGIDTIWIEDGLLPENMDIFCGACSGTWNYGSGCYCKVFPKLRRLAMHQSVWDDPFTRSDGVEDVGTTDILRITETQELVIVVGDVSPMNDRDVVLVKPTSLPWEVLTKLGLSPDFEPSRRRRTPTIAESWDMAEGRLEGILKEFKDRRTKERKLEIEGKYHLDLSIIGADDLLSKWPHPGGDRFVGRFL
jgi:2EXR family